MIIIGFCTKTSKLAPRALCRHFRHCAPIVPMGEQSRELIMYQFVRRGVVVKIHLRMQDIRRLGAYGWRFVYIPGTATGDFSRANTWTCVGLCKHALNMRAVHILTPDDLYHHLTK